MRIDAWLQRNTQSLVGCRVAVTGSTGGLGKALCGYLAALGADLVLLDRSAARSEAHRKSLLTRYPNAEVTCISLDLERVEDAERVVEQLTKMGIDVFIHNAGAYSIPRHITSSGYENVFQINFATPYYMIQRLLPALRVRNGRAVVVGSIAHNYSKIDPADVDFSKRRAASRVYGNAKRYLMFALYALFRDEKEASLSVVHPGISFTGITAHYPKVIFALIKHPMKVIFMKPRKAALSILRGVFEGTEACEWIGPRVFNVWGLPKKQTLHTCAADERAQIEAIAKNVYERCRETVERDA